MSAKHDLQHSVIQTVKYNKDGSFKTQADRKSRLLLMADELNRGGYKIRHLRQIKFKHVRYLIAQWQERQLSAGTIKNRMGDLRWAMSKFGKSDLIPANNQDLNIPKRIYATKEDKSIQLTEGDLSNITDQNVKMSLLLQREFGLRREESIKIRIHDAVQGDELHLAPGWCKNGRPRVIKIRYPVQWQVIQQVKDFVGDRHRALIPDYKTYVQQQTAYDNQLRLAGISKAHGLRHAYAQKRYYDITGFHCPVKGGPTWRELTPEQAVLDKLARASITTDLGHSRLDVCSTYLSK